MILLTLDAFRALSIVAGAVSLFAIVWRALILRKELEKGPRLFYWAFSLILLTAIWDTWNMWVQGDEFSLRGVPYTLGVFCALVYVLEPRRSYMNRVKDDPVSPEPEDVQ